MRYKPHNQKKNHLVFFLFCIFSFVILSLTVGFSAASSTLAIDGSALVRSSADVRITDYRVASSNTTTSNSLTFTKNTVTSNNHLEWYWSSITYDVTVTNLSSNNVLLTNVETINLNNNIFSYHLENIEVNKTLIPPASTYTFQIVYEVSEGTKNLLQGTLDKLDNIFGGKDISLQSTVGFTFYKLPQYKYTINTNLADANVVISVGDNIIASGNGSASAIVDENTNLSWKVTLDGYYPQSGSEVVNDNVTKDITLSRTEDKMFTVVPTPSDALVTIRKKNKEVLVSGTGTQTIIISDLTELSYSVSRLEYKDASGDYTLNGEDYTVNVSLEELPWATGTFINTDRKVATTKEDVIYHPGYYLIELWGGRGGEYLRASSKDSGYRGEAGYIYGVVNLEYNSKIYFTLGGNARDGELSGTSRGGENGGGYGGATYAGGGGGYSAFAVGTTVIDEANINNGNVLMIAAGGGGGGGSSLVAGKPGNGGDGGNMNSEVSVISIGTVFHGGDGTLNGAKEGRNGLGGTTMSRSQSDAGKSGGLLYGGEGSGNGGGGGAGYYGGGGSGGAGTLSSNQPGGAGGGSSFMATRVTYSDLSTSVIGKLTGSNPSSSGGAIIITYLGKSI